MTKQGDRTNWAKTRETVIRRDGFTCQLCGATVKDQDLQVHHTTYMFGNDPAYLITLCTNCQSDADDWRDMILSSFEPDEMEREDFLTVWKERLEEEKRTLDRENEEIRSRGEAMVTLRDIIRQLSEKEDSAELSAIVSLAEERGLTVQRVEQILKRWVAEGEVYSPKKNRYALVGGRG